MKIAHKCRDFSVCHKVESHPASCLVDRGDSKQRKREAGLPLCIRRLRGLLLHLENVMLIKYEGVPRPSIEPGASAYDLQRYSDLWNCLPTSEAVWRLIGQRSGSETGLSPQ
jgi:hypothetical protein